MSTVLSWQRRYRRVLTALAERLERSSWMAKAELLVVAITAPILVVLVAWLGSALGLPLVLILAVATTLGLALVLPFMLRATLSSTPTETVGTLFIAPTSLAEDALSFSEDQDYEGWFGLMANSTSEDLTPEQVELLINLLVEYQDKADLNQAEWAEAQSTLDWLDSLLEDVSA